MTRWIPRLVLFRKREIYVPTALGWLSISIIAAVLLIAFMLNAHSFLAHNHPLESPVLIVEGWLPDFALRAALAEFNSGNYQYVLTTGGPLGMGHHLSGHKTSADLAASLLRQMGAEERAVIALPAPWVAKDRTHAAALEVKRWLAARPGITRMNLLTLGTHARRSHYLLREVLPSTAELGVIAIAPEDYDPERWWRSSAGVRAVVFEGIACLYVLIF